MTTSIEPGYYEDGRFGIRIENVFIVVVVNTPYRFGDINYLGFDCVTMTPINTNLIRIDMLTDKEIDWINAYNMKVRLKLQNLMDTVVPESSSYLIDETKPIARS